MDISQAIAQMKRKPGFTEKVGMVLVHNGVVRGRPRSGDKVVERLEVRPDTLKIEAICREMSGRPGIFEVAAQAETGVFSPGEDLLFIIVAGDIRENVLETMTLTLNRIKAEAVAKSEHYLVE